MPINTLNSGSLFITANQRLAAYLRQQHDNLQHAAGHKTWPSLACLPLKQWLIECYSCLPDTPLLLAPSQELVLWEKIVSATNPDFPLLRPRATAQIAAEAWHLLRQWQLPLAALLTNDSVDIQTFVRWAQDYRALCQKQHWADFTDCVTTLTQRMAEIASLPHTITLVGFEEIHPQMRTFLAALEKHTQLHFVKTPPKTTQCNRIACTDEENEIRNMADWASETWQKNPEYKIACIVPKLNTLREPIERIFAQTTPTSLPLNISGGYPLESFPLIHTALRILRIDVEKISMEQLSQFLRSPFIAGAEQEISQRAIADIQLRKLNERFFSLTHILRTTQLPALCPLFARQLDTYAQHKILSKQLPSIWAKFFAEQLNLLGWPGERSLNSAEYQQLQRWQALLQEFASLDLVYAEKIHYHAAVSQLQNLAKNTLFQPQNTATSIQVLGLLEAVGMEFDALWVMGMNEEQWPQAPSPNPFIPQPLQRQHQMPHACPEREFHFSQRLTQLFSQSAPRVIFSYSVKKDDTALYPSPLILEFPSLNETFFSTAALSKPVLSAWEYVQDDIAPKLDANETARGGASILKHQAACPFRAFAKSRLHAEGLPMITAGLSAQERGNYLHEILEQLWRRLEDQHTLNNLSETQLEGLIESIVEKILKTKIQLRPQGLQPNFCTIEKQRLKERTKSWLAIEKNRPPFRVVNQEAFSEVEFFGLRLHLRIDREDALENGDRIIVDYKTGIKSHIGDWFSERPNDPQLPLYCLTRPSPVAGLAFAQIHVSKFVFKGISANNTDITGIIPIAKQNADKTIQTWDAFQKIQNETLSALAKNFQAGDAKVDPKDASSCKYCDLQALCRVQEAAHS